MATREQEVWSGRPSQLTNITTFIVCVLFFWLVIPLLMGAWAWLQTRYKRFELTNERLRIRAGVLNKSVDVLELYRVKDLHISQPFLLRLFGLGNVVLITSDKTHPRITINAIANSEQLADTLREHIEAMRIARGVREFD